MSRLRVTLACGDYDRTRHLADGRIPVEGVDLTYLRLPAEDVFHRMLAHEEFDVAELSLSSYVLTLFEQQRRFVAVPVFPSRSFRHGGIWVRADSTITTPAELAGRRVGIPEFQMTASVWIRGILDEWHDLPVEAPRYRTGGLLRPGRTEKLPLQLPPELDVRPIDPGETLTQLLVDGEIDALYTARAPSLPDGPAPVRPLFADPAAVERDYAERTGIFPIMHTLVLRRELYEAHRWLARALLEAFTAARDVAYRDLADTTALATTLPWQVSAHAGAQRLLGRDYWPYGIEANERTLSVFLRYSAAQGLARRVLEPRELFAPETVGGHVV